MGELPGDIPRSSKIAMLERKAPFYVWPWQEISVKCAKGYKRDHIKKANRRMRRKAIEY